MTPTELERGDPRVLLVVFSGMRGGFGMPAFEFSRIATDLACTKLYIRDPNQAWYQKRLRPYWGGIESVVSHIEGVRDGLGSERLVLIGNSMGSYAALAVAPRMKIDCVVVFSPITFINPFLRLRHRDRRWQPQVARAWGSRLVNWRTFDVSKALAGSDLTPGQVQVHYNYGHRLDRVHAERLNEVATLHGYDGTDHSLIRTLRDRGALLQLLTAAIRAPNNP